MKSVVTLCYTTIYKMEATFLQHTHTLAQAEHSSVSASEDSGATHNFWPYYKSFIMYNHVYNQDIMLVNDSKIRISGKGTVSIEMEGKKIIICNLYNVPDLCLPLFSLHFHRHIPGCGYHSNNDSVICFFSMFHVVVDDAVDTYVNCCYIGRKTIKLFDYIQPCDSANRAAAGSFPCCSTRLNPPPPTPTMSVPPPTALPAIPDTEEKWEYDNAIELDVNIPDSSPMAPTDTKPTS